MVSQRLVKWGAFSLSLLLFFLISSWALAQEPQQRKYRLRRTVGAGVISGFDGAAVPFVANAVDFDGTSDFLTRGAELTGVVDGKKGILSVWLRIDGGDGVVQRYVSTAGNDWKVSKSSSNKFELKALNAASATILQVKSTAAFTASSAWINILYAWDLSVPVAHLFIDDVDDEAAGSTETDDNIDYLGTGNWAVAALTGGGSKVNGCVAELYFNSTEFLDISIESNRRKFIDASGKPVDLGSDGSTPTGTSPIVYLNGDSTNFETNQGTGGNFSVTGSLTDCSTSPTD